MAKSSTSVAVDLIRSIADENTTLLADGLNSAEITGYIDTGSYLLNMLLSGDMFHGMPDNKILALAGETTTGKTYLAKSIARGFMERHPESIVSYCDTESSVTSESFTESGMDAARVAITEKRTIEEFRFFLEKLLGAYEKMKDRPPLLSVLDSLGGLISDKLVEDTAKGKVVADPGRRAQVIKQTFQLYTLKLAQLHVPMIVTNHTYTTIGSYIPMKEMAGGSGLKYFADYILFLSKKKVRDKDDKSLVTGIEVTVTNIKNRLAKENASVDILINYERGLDRYYGLLEAAVDSGLIDTKSGGWYTFPDGRKVQRPEIDQNPDQFFTTEMLGDLNNLLKPQFNYGKK